MHKNFLVLDLLFLNFEHIIWKWLLPTKTFGQCTSDFISLLYSTILLNTYLRICTSVFHLFLGLFFFTGKRELYNLHTIYVLYNMLADLRIGVCYIHVEIESCHFTFKQTSLLHFTEMLRVFKSSSEAIFVTTSTVKCWKMLWD